MGLHIEWKGRGVEVKWTDQRFSVVVPVEQAPMVVAHYYSLSEHRGATCPVCAKLDATPKRKARP